MAENIVISSAILMITKINESDSSSSDEEWELLKEKRKRSLRPRMKNIELVIELYSDDEFKSHFRLDILSFIFILIINADGVL